MVKALIETGNGTVLLLGLSRLNVDRMMADKPILIRPAEDDIDLTTVDDIVIVFGETETAIAEQILKVHHNGIASTERP